MLDRFLFLALWVIAIKAIKFRVVYKKKKKCIHIILYVGFDLIQVFLYYSVYIVIATYIITNNIRINKLGTSMISAAFHERKKKHLTI